MIHDPVHRMLERKTENRTANLIRNKLQLQARSLLSKYFDLMSQDVCAHKRRVSQLIGEIEGYISIRRELAPMVCQDGFSDELTQKLHKLKALEPKNAC